MMFGSPTAAVTVTRIIGRVAEAETDFIGTADVYAEEEPERGQKSIG